MSIRREEQPICKGMGYGRNQSDCTGPGADGQKSGKKGKVRRSEVRFQVIRE
jgi:hypothetical protein